MPVNLPVRALFWCLPRKGSGNQNTYAVRVFNWLTILGSNQGPHCYVAFIELSENELEFRSHRLSDHRRVCVSETRLL